MEKPNKRDYCVWCCETNFLLRAGYLLKLRWKDVLTDMNIVNEYITITEEKTSKFKKIKVNEDARESLLLYIEYLREVNMDDLYDNIKW